MDKILNDKVGVWLDHFCDTKNDFLNNLQENYAIIIKANGLGNLKSDNYSLEAVSPLTLFLHYREEAPGLKNGIPILIEINNKEFLSHHIGFIFDPQNTKRCANCQEEVKIVCPRCRSTDYCSKSCALSDWKNHRDDCLRYLKAEKKYDQVVYKMIQDLKGLQTGKGYLIQGGKVIPYPLRKLIFALDIIGITLPCPVVGIPVVIEFYCDLRQKFIYKIIYQ